MERRADAVAWKGENAAIGRWLEGGIASIFYFFIG